MSDWTDPTGERAIRWLSLVLLAASALVATALAVLTGYRRENLALTLVVTGVAAAWTVLYHPFGRGNAHPGVYFAVRLVLTAVLVGLNGWFGIYAWAAYVEASRVLSGRWRYGALAAIAPIAAASYLGGYPTQPVLVLVWLGLAAGSFAMVALIVRALLRANDKEEERERMLGELTEANRRLEDALTENRGLQTQLVTQAREAGVMDERTRLAGEIHDTLAQALTGIIRQIEAADRGGELAGGARPHVDRAAELARDGLAEARRSLRALRPGQLENSTLPDAITDVARRAALPVAVEVSGLVRPLNTDQEVVLLRVVQEALTNVEKHASASRAGVTLTYFEDAVILDVRDDGVGFDPADAGTRNDGTGVGLAAMRERLSRVAGELVVESAPGEGTALVAALPCVTAAPSAVAGIA